LLHGGDAVAAAGHRPQIQLRLHQIEQLLAAGLRTVSHWRPKLAPM
jgi:hypothetical protein